jgi:hypothetical protein
MRFFTLPIRAAALVAAVFLTGCGTVSTMVN